MEMKLDAGILEDVAKGVKSVEQDEMYVRFGDGHWAVRSQGPAGAIMVASRVKQDRMEKYEKGNVEAMGIEIDTVLNFIQKSSEPLRMEYKDEERKLRMRHCGMTVETGTIGEGYVSGADTGFPKVSYGVNFEIGKSFISNFISKSEDVINSSAFMIEARENNLYLYSNKDEKKLLEEKEWDNLSEYHLDWSAETVDQDEKRATASFGTQFLNSLFFPDDNVTVYLANQAPIKMFSAKDEGVETTYFAAPRIPDGSDMVNKVPGSVLRDEDKLKV